MHRPLFSSLLVAMPVEQWHKRDNAYECTEAEYISEVEGDLFQLEGVLINMVVQRLLETQTSLGKDKILQVHTTHFWVHACTTILCTMSAIVEV